MVFKLISGLLTLERWFNYSSDINECTVGTDNCHARAVCTNTIGSFTCTCQSGYAGNGVICSGEWHLT